MFSGLIGWLADHCAWRKPVAFSNSPARFFEADFNSAWYLQAYPDVADAGLDPWEHFSSKGLVEGRLPSASKAAVLDFRLWGGLEHPVLSELKALSEGVFENGGEPLSRGERGRAVWALGRWCYCKGDEKEALAALTLFISDENVELDQPGPYLLLAELLRGRGRLDESVRVLNLVEQYFPGVIDITRARLSGAAQGFNQFFDLLNIPFLDSERSLIAQGLRIFCDASAHDRADDAARVRAEAIKAGLFDGNWYLEQNEDVLRSTMDPFDHFWATGDFEGRDPGPGFSTSGYRYCYPGVRHDESALAHYLSEGRSTGYSAVAEIDGALAEYPEATTIMLCGHQAGKQIYGAERSLLDLLAGFQRARVNLIVVLPSAINETYVSALKARAQKLVILPYGWWVSGRASCSETVTLFRQLLLKYKVDALYANTSVLNEPLEAARAEGVPTVVHVRELPQWDDALCRVLNTGLEEWQERIRNLADVLVVNSLTVAEAIGGGEAFVLPNIVDPDAFELARASRKNTDDVVRVGLVSSNLPKKGLGDFLALAAQLSERESNIQCVIVGPENAHIEALRNDIALKKAPGNILLAGYTATPQAALEWCDILVNLSHFQESFGRTVLEAMAAAKPVVAYEWGALPELIEDGASGFLVPLGDIEKVADRVIALSKNSELRYSMGRAGYEIAVKHYGLNALSERLPAVIQRLENLSARAEEP